MQPMQTAEFISHFQRRFPHCVGRPVLVALSGGRDSVALLHLLGQPSLHLSLEAAHVHHDLRGAEADDDAEFCRRLAASLEIPFQLLRLPLDDRRPTTGEAAWRRKRYRALLEHARRRGIGAIATAHHLDDVAEGVLVQILRGAGPRAMAGIAAETADGVIRPLLAWDRPAIDRWLDAEGLSWREDSSNRDPARLRNRVRHHLLPELERAAPRLRRHLVQMAGVVADGEDFMAGEVRRRASFADPWDPEGGVDLESLRALPNALRARWLQGQMFELGVDGASRRQLELFHLLLDAGRPRSVTMGGRWRLRAARGALWAEPPSPPEGVERRLEPDRPDGVGVPGWRVRIRISTEPDPTARWTWRPRSDASAITMRPAADGDVLLDRAGNRRRLPKVLSESLPRHLRSWWPVICEDDMIQWIPGVWQHPDPGDPSGRIVEVIRR
jgi:tRNA(Ile)-lysidine synthase